MRIRVPTNALRKPARDATQTPSSPAAAVGNLETQRAVRSIPFPHEDAIRHSLGVPHSFAAVVDPAGCAARGTPAFNADGVAHFAQPAPPLHVAAHEAAHQLQDAGHTRDAGLGAEGHAGAVADHVVGGRSARRLIGARGRRVSPAARGYTETEKDGKWAGLDVTLGWRLSDTGQTLTEGKGSHEAWAEPALITAGNAELQARKSRIALSAGTETLSVIAPNDKSTHLLSKVLVSQPEHPGSDLLPSACEEIARDVMGPGRGGKAPAAVVSPGGLERDVGPQKWKLSAKESLALTLLIDRKIRELPGYPNVSDADKRQAADDALADYAKLDDTKKDEFIEKLEGKHLAAGRAKELGMDEYAQPGIGEAYSIVRAGSYDQHTEYPYHWATVIMIAGQDHVTIENEAKRKTNEWFMNTYGPMSKHQTFHEEEKGSYGADAHTLRLRTQTPVEAHAGQLPTYKLFEALAKGEPDANVKGEVQKRFATINVECSDTNNLLEDDIYVTVTSGSKSATAESDEGVLGTGILPSSSATLRKGNAKLYKLPLSSLNWPLSDPLTVNIFDDVPLGKDVLIGSFSWAAPYKPKSDEKVTNGKAIYKVSISL